MAQQNQAKHYNKVAKPLSPLRRGDSVYLRLPGSTIWSPGTCKQLVAPRSYVVECNGTTYRRNRRHLRKARAETLPHKPYIDHDDCLNEREEEDREPEPIPTNNASVMMNPQPNDSIRSPQSVPQRTSSFGRIIRTPRRFIELPSRQSTWLFDNREGVV